MTPERSTIGPASQRDGQGSKGVDATAAARRRALGEAPREADLTTAGRRLPARMILNAPLLRQASLDLTGPHMAWRAREHACRSVCRRQEPRSEITPQGARTERSTSPSRAAGCDAVGSAYTAVRCEAQPQGFQNVATSPTMISASGRRPPHVRQHATQTANADEYRWRLQ
jgi:hypothetical protein